MNKNIKKLTATVLALLMLPIAAAPAVAEITASDNLQGIYYYTDFESTSNILFGHVGSIVDTTENHIDNALCIKPNLNLDGYRYSEYKLKLNESVTDYVISFDFKAAQTDQAYNLRVSDCSDEVRVDLPDIKLDGSGDILIGTQVTDVKYQANTWYTVDVEISSTAADYYINGSLIETVTQEGFLPTDLFFGTDKDGSDGSERLYIDNIMVTDGSTLKATGGSLCGGDRFVKVLLSQSIGTNTLNTFADTDFSIKYAGDRSLEVIGKYLQGHCLYLYVNEDIKPYTEYIITLPEGIKSMSEKSLSDNLVYVEAEAGKPVIGEIIAQNDFENGNKDGDNLTFNPNAYVSATVEDKAAAATTEATTKALKLSVANTAGNGSAKFTIAGDSPDKKQAIVQYDILLENNKQYSFMPWLNTQANSQKYGAVLVCNATGQFRFLTSNSWPNYNVCMEHQDGTSTSAFAVENSANRWYRVTMCVNRDENSDKFGTTDLYIDNRYIGSANTDSAAKQEYALDSMLLTVLDFTTFKAGTNNGGIFGSESGAAIYVDNIKIGYAADESNVVKSRVIDESGEVYKPLETVSGTAKEIEIYFSDAIDTRTVTDYSVKLVEKSSGKNMKISYTKFRTHDNCLVMSVDEALLNTSNYDVIVEGVASVSGKGCARYIGEYKMAGADTDTETGKGIIDSVYAENGKIKVNGYAESGTDGVPVAAILMKNDKTLTALDEAAPEDYFDYALNQNQTITADNGYYEFTFGVPDGSEGEYDIYVYTADSDAIASAGAVLYTNGAALDCAVESTAFGNSFYDPKNVNFDISASGMLTEGAYKVKASVYNRADNSFVGETESTIATDAVDYTLNIDMTEMSVQYGNFNLVIEVTDEVNKHEYKYETRFTVSNAADYGLKKADTGFANHFRGYQGGTDLDNIGKSIDLELYSGSGLVREEIHWADFEQEQGVYTLTDRQKAWLDEANERNIKPLIILAFDNQKLYGAVTNPPTEANTSKTDSSGNPITGLQAYGNYVYEVVSATKEYTDIYEVWNEYDLSFNDDAAAENYAKLLKTAYDNAKRANPDCKVYGFAATRSETTYWIDEVLTKAEELYQDAKVMDGFSYHPYPYDESKPEVAGIKDEVEDIKAELKEYGYEDIEVIASEMGYISDETYESQLKQAKYSVRFAALSEGYLDKLIWYVSGEKEAPRGEFEQYGFFKNIDAEIPCETKPVYTAVTNYNALTLNSEITDRNISGGIYKYTFENEYGGQVIMIWSDGETAETHTIALNGYPYVKVYDMFGNSRMCTEGEVIPISDSPVYIEYKKNFTMYVRNSEGMASYRIGDLKGQSFDIVVKSDDTLSEFENSVMIAGCYKDGLLTDVINKSVEYNSDAEIENVIIIPAENEGYDEIKLFLWDGQNRVTPLIQSVEIK